MSDELQFVTNVVLLTLSVIYISTNRVHIIQEGVSRVVRHLSWTESNTPTPHTGGYQHHSFVLALPQCRCYCEWRRLATSARRCPWCQVTNIYNNCVLTP